MRVDSVRLTRIQLNNFKNVVNGELSFENPRKEYKASVLGLYGQNGSGKTALIDALGLLKIVLCGKPVPGDYSDYINVDSEKARLQFDFIMEYEGQEQPVVYSFEMMKETTESLQNNQFADADNKTKIRIVNEVIKCRGLEGKMGRLLDTGGAEVLTPIAKRQLLVGKSDDTDLVVNKKITYVQSRSFIFSPELMHTIRTHSLSVELTNDDTKEFDFYSSIIEGLVYYGNYCLFVINTSNTGLISLQAQPLVFRYNEQNKRSSGIIMLPLSEPAVIPEVDKDFVDKIIQNLNTVLASIIPGLTVVMKELGRQLLDNGAIGVRVQLMSSKNGKQLPLKNESEGIKKIISILQLLVVVYNQSSITVAIDELDAGVFEYLLGELVRIISEKGKGQLIFTSHNLRPLETLDRGFVAFTTTNPEKRYVRMVGVKDSNNLRDLYYRDIMLSENNEDLYETTKNSEIAFAFREAGVNSVT